MRDLLRALLSLLALCVFALGARAQEFEVPRYEGWVTDAARVLSAAQRSELEARLSDFERRSTHELALLTIPSLKGVPIERFALEVGRSWKIGKAGKNDGALLLVAVEDRELRIEVGRGLEGELTDALCGRVIRDVIVPHLRAGDMAGGLRAGLEALMRLAGGEGAASLPAQPAGGSAQTASDGVPAGWIALTILGLVLVAIAVRHGGGPRMRGPFGRFGGPGGGFFGGGFPRSGFPGGGFGSGGFRGFGGGGGFSGGGASGRW